MRVEDGRFAYRDRFQTTPQKILKTKEDLETVDNKNTAIIKVVDTGVGISDEIINNIFARFQRDSTNESVFSIEGSGLGLAVCKEIVELHGGVISVNSKKGHGTTFTVELPLT